MGKPSTKSLISGNGQLSKLGFPYNENYAYFRLADKLRISLEKILSQAYIPSTNKEKIQIYEKKLPRDVRSYQRHKEGKVDQTACLDLLDLLYELIGYTTNESKAPYGGLDLTVIEDLKATHKYIGDAEQEKANVKLIQWRVVRDFWLRARSCTNLASSIPKEHTGLKLLDLISACSGYRNFADFLETEFGEDYDPKKDGTLQALSYSAAKPPILESTNHKTGQSLKRTIAFYLKRAMRNFTPAKPKKKNSLNQWKAQSEEPAPFGSRSKESTRRLITFMPKLLLIMLGCLGTFMFIARTEEAQVNVTLTTRFLHFQIAQASNLRSPDRLLLGSRNHFSIRNAIYSLDYPFSDTLPSAIRIKAVLDELVGIEHIQLPNDSKVTIETPTDKDLYIEFSESEGLNGFIPIDHSIVFSPEGVDSVIYGQNPNGTGINFQSYKDQSNGISLFDADEFEWPPFYVKSMSFGELKHDQVEYGIESAHIDFLKSEKSLKLNPKDLFSLAFSRPIKLLIKYKDGLVLLQFTGMVDSLYAGPEIYGKSKLSNQMPRLWEAHKVLLAIVVIIIVLAFPVVIMSNSRTQYPI